MEIFWKLHWFTEAIVHHTCPRWFRRWYFTHKWELTYEDAVFFFRIVNNKSALLRRYSVMTEEEIKAWEEACLKIKT